MEPPRYLAAGETALVVEFGRTISTESHRRVLALDAALAARPPEGLVETVPTYRSLMIHYAPRHTSFSALVAAIEALGPIAAMAPGAGRRWILPVCYDPPHAEDLDAVAARLGRPAEEIVALHLGADYEVVMYGFAPGFVFLGGLAPELTISRRDTPRPPAPPGALTIAGGQALVASIAMPTGWYMLGRTPARTFDPRRDPVFPLGVGDRVRLERIDAARFAALAAEAEAGGAVLREGF